MALVGILAQIMLLFGPLVIQLVWYILKQLFTSVSVKVVDIYRAAKRGKYPPLRCYGNQDKLRPGGPHWPVCRLYTLPTFDE